MTLTALLLLALLQSPVAEATAPPAAEPIALEEVLQAVREATGVPGLAAAVLEGDRIAAAGAVGLRAREWSAPVTREDLWHIGSCTKSMTATLAGVLCEEGVVGFDWTLDRLFPELAEGMSPDWKRVTLLQVLQHRGGFEVNALREWLRLTHHEGGVTGARAELARTVLLQPPQRKPGEFLYSNVGYVIAGAALERATGKSWEDLMRERLFAPLGMTTAGFGAPGGIQQADQPRGHASGRSLPPGPDADNPPWMGPAGTVHLSVADWGRFLALHLAGARGEPTPLLSRETFAELHRPEGESRYACGWIVQPRDWARGDVLIHNGSNTMWYCVVFLAPERDLAMMALCNEAGEAAARACDQAASLSFAAWEKARRGGAEPDEEGGEGGEGSR